LTGNRAGSGGDARSASDGENDADNSAESVSVQSGGRDAEGT